MSKSLMETSNLSFRIIKDKLFQAGIIFFAAVTIVPLLLILFYIVRNGIAVIDWQFLTSLPKPVGEVGGGISNAIVGTLMLIVIACGIAIPLGVCSGIYLSEKKEGKLAYLVRLSVEILQGIP
ncbi:MAG: phosphate ABC transporter permease PtsA, partial [Thermodesulfobacteriota bacterium]|nr:phosphate ABC transporter permease PtsA [Thermodesulfobacteriota bacterium]